MGNMRGVWTAAALFALLLSACRPGPPPAPTPTAPRFPDLGLGSPAFADGEAIPVRYTCDGADRSPPPGTRSLALVVDDPDAPRGRFVHWLLYRIPPERTALPEGVPTEPMGAGLGVQGRNDFGRIGYGGPCPHRGRLTATGSPSTPWTSIPTFRQGPRPRRWNKPSRDISWPRDL